MQTPNEQDLISAYRQMSREDQIAILSISMDRAQANRKPRPTLRLVSSNPDTGNSGALGDVLRRRNN